MSNDMCYNCGAVKPTDRFRACPKCRKEWREAQPRKTVDRHYFITAIIALEAISNGEGVYGAQAGQYKQIARIALNKIKEAI